MTCNECIHKAVCYRVDSVPSDYARKCGDFVSGCKALDQEPCTVSVSEKEPNEITEEVTLRFFKNSLKVRWHGFVIYNVEWLKRHWQMEMDIVCGVKPCKDAISRQAVHETIEKWAGSMAVLVALPTREVRPLLDSIHKLPSVNPQKSGHWIEHPEIETSTPEYLMFYECSECGNKQCFYKADTHRRNYCGTCGVRMRGAE